MLAVLMAALMLLSLAACGDEGGKKSKDKDDEEEISEESFVGTWGEADDTQLVLDDDGTGVFTLWGESTDIKWKLKDDKVTFKADEKYTVTLKGKSGSQIKVKNETGNINTVLDKQKKSKGSKKKKSSDDDEDDDEDEDDDDEDDEDSGKSGKSGKSKGDWIAADQKDDSDTPGTYYAYAYEASGNLIRPGDAGADTLLDITVDFEDDGTGQVSVMGVELDIAYEDGTIWYEALKGTDDGILYTYACNGDELFMADTSGIGFYYLRREGSDSETALSLRGF